MKEEEDVKPKDPKRKREADEAKRKVKKADVKPEDTKRKKEANVDGRKKGRSDSDAPEEQVNLYI